MSSQEEVNTSCVISLEHAGLDVSRQSSRLGLQAGVTAEKVIKLLETYPEGLSDSSLFHFTFVSRHGYTSP